MKSLRMLIFGSLAAVVVSLLAASPAAAYERHPSDIGITADLTVTVVASVDLDKVILVLPAAVEAEHIAKLERGSELPPIERTAAAPLLAPVYQLSLITGPRAIVDHPLRC